VVKPAAVKLSRKCAVMPQLRGVQPSSTAGPNTHKQIGPWATAICVKLCGLDKSLAAC